MDDYNKKNMEHINIIDKVYLANDGELRTFHMQKVHLHQGELDGACAVYSMMMCLIIEKITSRSMLKNPPEKLKRSTADGRLVRFFLENQGMVVNGYLIKKLHEDLKSAYNKKVNSYYYSSDDTNVVDEIIRCLDENHPVEIGFNYMVGMGGHAVVAIGYRISKKSISLFCVDPSYPMDKCQMWNNVLEIDTKARAKYNCKNIREDFKVKIDEIMYFEKK